MENHGRILIGRCTALAMGLIILTSVNAVESSVAAPGEFSKIKGVMVEIPINKDVKPVVQPYRRVAVPLENRVNEKVDSLCRQGIIERVDGPSKWVSPLVVTPQGEDDVRLCVDMRRPNMAVERENHPLPRTSCHT